MSRHAFATESVAAKSIVVGFRSLPAACRSALYILLAGLVVACGAIDKPVRPVVYDFGPGVQAVPAAVPLQSLPALVLADIEAAGALDGSAVFYRLGYADGNQLRPYAQARWSAPPPQLVLQRLRQQLGRDRVVLSLGESATLTRTGGIVPRVLRIELEEFSHYFESPVQSSGLLRFRATLLEATSGGEKVLAQRAMVIQRPAASADASGGVRALVAATDAAAGEISQWLQQTR